VLYGILYRAQCIKIARLLEAKGRGSGGQKWVIAFYKQIFEKKKGFDHYSQAEKKVKWADARIIADYEKDKKDNRWLVQSKNRLLRLYDLVSTFLH
jgi:hypothetical protein